MSETLAEQLEALEAKATPGPWQFDGNCGGYIEEDGERIGRFYTFDDIPLIVALRNNVPAIIAALHAEAEATELREENARLRAGKRFYIDCEFDGHGGPLLSMALVADDLVSIHITVDDAPPPNDPWVAENILPIMGSHLSEWDARCPLYEVGGLLRHMIGERPATVIADSPVDIGRFCEAISTASDGSWCSFGLPLIRFEVHNVDCWPNDMPGAVQHNAWWDAMALRTALENPDG